jgi:hypothetical protein
MAAPKHMAKKRRAVLGSEAGDSMVEWLDDHDTHCDELHQETRAEFAAIRQEIRQEIGALREEMRAGFAAAEARFTGIDSKIVQGFAGMEVKLAQRNAELMKWALGFWIASLLGVVGALAALARMPR